MAVSARDYEAALDRLEPIVRAAFLASVQRMTSRARIDALSAALVAGDVETVMIAAGFRPGAFDQLVESIRVAFSEGGGLLAETAPASVGFVFSVTADRAAEWVRANGAILVTEIRDQIRQVIADEIAQAIHTGTSPRTAALRLVGRIDRTTGRRSGGLVGLHSSQAAAVRRMREELRSGDAVQMTRYFGRARRDKRFDGLAARAIQAGRPVAGRDIDRMTQRYADRLLKLRGDTIARTESLQALNAGQGEAVEQAIEQGLISRPNARKIWRTAADSRVRDDHQTMDGNTAASGQPFQSGSGAFLLWPGDRSLGAGGGDIINCRCRAVHQVDWISQAVDR